MNNIIQYTNDPKDVLRSIAADIPVEDIPGSNIQKIITRMKQALSEQHDGVAIAAPQVGESLRMFVVSGKVFVPTDEEGKFVDDPKNHPGRVFINPIISKLSRKKLLLEEGCLSVRWLYGKVKRAQKATVTGYNENGEKIQHGGSGLLAQIFQHETDHLNGVLFIDKAGNLAEYEPEQS